MYMYMYIHLESTYSKYCNLIGYNSVTLIFVEPRCNFVEPQWCFWQCKPLGEAWHRQLVRGSCCGWQWAVLVVNGAQNVAMVCRAKDRAVAWDMIFSSKTHHLLVTKLCLNHTHCHQMPNQTVCHTKIPRVISRRSDMTVEHFVYKNVYSKVI